MSQAYYIGLDLPSLKDRLAQLPGYIEEVRKHIEELKDHQVSMTNQRDRLQLDHTIRKQKEKLNGLIYARDIIIPAEIRESEKKLKDPSYTGEPLPPSSTTNNDNTKKLPAASRGWLGYFYNQTIGRCRGPNCKKKNGNNNQNGGRRTRRAKSRRTKTRRNHH